MSSDLIGQMLGPYQIIEFVGLEGAAETFKGYHSEQNIPVLIRLAGRGLPADPVWSTRFRSEAKAIAGLKHANIAPVLDFGEALDGHYMVSELIEGTTLADWLLEARAGGRNLLPDDITFIVRQIAAGLDDAHAKGVIHRDVSPRRVLITRSGQAILTDFGLPLLLSRGAEAAAGGAAFGAPEYMAPEVIVDFRAAAPASDIYSLGAILYEVVTGELPFGEWSDAAAVLRKMTAGRLDPHLVTHNVPPTVSHTITTALAVTPKDRFKNAMQFAEQLEWAYHNPTADLSRPRRNAKAAEPTITTRTTEALPEAAPGATSEPVVVKRGPSLQDERREKARLRAEHRKQQQEEKKQIAEQKRGEQQAAARAFFRLWGRTFIVLTLFIGAVLGILYGLRSAGILIVNVPTIQVVANVPARPSATAPTYATADVAATTEPVTQPVEATPTPPDAVSILPSATVELTPLDAGSSAFRLADGGAMVFVPAGQFLMGTNDVQFNPSARPQHPVILSNYWIDRTEVTNAQYRVCVASGHCQEPTKTVYYADPDFADFPVTFVPYQYAASYCLWLGTETGQAIGLPTEAQWEKAAAWDPVSGKQRLFPWGNQQPDNKRARYVFSTTYGPASPVGSYPDGASAYGALDMAGNVWEWTADWFDPEYYQQANVATDPTGPFNGTYRVTRGGSWRVEPSLLVSLKRNPAEPTTSSGDALGFRCAMTAERPPVDSGVLTTPLDATQGLAGLVNALKGSAGADQAVVSEWLAALEKMRSAFESGDQAAALTLAGDRLDRLKEQQSVGQIDASLAWRLKRGLVWIQSQLAAGSVTTGTPATDLMTATAATGTPPDLTASPGATGTAPDLTGTATP